MVHRRTDETKEKIRQSLLGHGVSEETRKKISEKAKGRKVSSEALKKWFGKKHHLGHKHSDEAKRKMSIARLGKKLTDEHKRKVGESQRGKKNHFWKGGISYEIYPVEWTKTLRRAIRERDRYICQTCGAQQEDKAFHVHHIDYDKKNCDPKNLITLCRKCHLKTNFNREKWREFFAKSLR